MASPQQAIVLPCTTLLQPPKPLDTTGDLWRNWTTWKFSDARLHDILQATENDAAFIQLREYASASWPAEKRDVPEELRTYWNYRDEMHVEDGLVFRSNKVVIPKAKRTEILKLLHAAHGGEAKMKMRAREVMYWPTMSCDIEALAKSCGVCTKHKPRNARLPLLSHELPNLPWQLVGLDLFYHNNRTFLIIVDFYSFFFEIKELRQSTASSVVSACAEVFATHGIPAKLCSDNGPPFNSYNFKDFVSKFRIIHVTSSPHHPRSNGMAERAVQEAKKLLTRCSYDTLDFCSALLEWRNSPRDNLLKSPVQRLMGRQTRTLLPVPDCCLEPAIVPPKEVHKRLQEIRSKQRTSYNRTKALPELQDGQQVSAFDTISHTWSPAVVMRRAGPPRSFVIETGDGRVLRRTREHLRVLPPRQQQLVTTAAAESTGRQVREEPSTGAPPSQDPPTQELRRSSRQRRSPVRYPRPEL
ncbi:uncharacterized protein K02A2.6-like isoform X1 [Ixodes scapularis]|uniref:uncharacterized protein K02A2.6-like isoform X1 n=2 Tax=Ixodes scapularis TaxID=6945 RepID=UPI001AD64E63|nr:uncharacterized protein K02A2.6-like isoform X1 [Ixodes scapularis]